MTTDTATLIGALAGGAFVVGIVFERFWRRWRRGRAAPVVSDEPEGTAYRIYTTEFDQEGSHDRIIASLATSSPDSLRGWIEPASDWRKAVEAAQSIEDRCRPLLDRLDSDLVSLLRNAASAPADTALTILVDQSGSMKGRPIQAVTSTVRRLADTAAAEGVKVEVLGHSTAGWHGGHARLKWIEEGRPARPGRLCALRHIIYKSAGEPCLSEPAAKAMLHPALLRENVDGEALAWAARRLVERRETRKLLLVVSDGAPVDDATLYANGPSYLWRHLVTTIAGIESDAALALGVLILEHSGDRLYARSVTAPLSEDVPEAAGDLLAKML